MLINARERNSFGAALPIEALALLRPDFPKDYDLCA
jgi:hypothetical protein